MKIRLISLFLVSASLSSTLFGGPVMATVLQRKGAVAAADATGKRVDTTAGSRLAETVSLRVSSGGELAFVPFPSSLVILLSAKEHTLSSIERLHLNRNANQVLGREAALRLDAGRLFFGIEKFDPRVSKLGFPTPYGMVSAAGTEEKAPLNAAGMIEVTRESRQVSIISGLILLRGQERGDMRVAAGSVATTDNQGTQVLNLIAGKVAIYDSAGIQKGERSPTAAEFEAARVTFGGAVNSAEQTASTGYFGEAFSTAMTQTLTQVNQALAVAGLPALDQIAVGAKDGEQSVTVSTLPSAPGAGSVNPANISGIVRSNER